MCVYIESIRVRLSKEECLSYTSLWSRDLTIWLLLLLIFF